jgi:hypothetical protein
MVRPNFDESINIEGTQESYWHIARWMGRIDLALASHERKRLAGHHHGETNHEAI